MTEVDEETRDQFRRVIDLVLDSKAAVDQEFDTSREQARSNNYRILTVLDGMSKELRDLRQEYHSLNAAVYRIEASFDRQSQETRDDVTDIRRHLSEIDVRLRKLESRGDHDA